MVLLVKLGPSTVKAIILCEVLKQLLYVNKLIYNYVESLPPFTKAG